MYVVSVPNFLFIMFFGEKRVSFFLLKLSLISLWKKIPFYFQLFVSLLFFDKYAHMYIPYVYLSWRWVVCIHSEERTQKRSWEKRARGKSVLKKSENGPIFSVLLCLPACLSNGLIKMYSNCYKYVSHAKTQNRQKDAKNGTQTSFFFLFYFLLSYIRSPFLRRGSDGDGGMVSCAQTLFIRFQK